MRRTAALALVAVISLSSGCGSEGDSSSTEIASSVDPATLEGACGLLLGPEATLVDDALAAGKAVTDGDEDDSDRVSRIQNSLFKLVAVGPETIQDPAGTLVDYLDDPAAYTTEDKVSSTITDAVDEIEQACKAETGDNSGY